MRSYVKMGSCPFQAGDRVRCDHTKDEGTIEEVFDEFVRVLSDRGVIFHRTWTHELGFNSGGGLTRITRPSPDDDDDDDDDDDEDDPVPLPQTNPVIFPPDSAMEENHEILAL